MWKEKILGKIHHFIEKEDVEHLDFWNLLTGTENFSSRSRPWNNAQIWTDTGQKIEGLSVRSSSLNWRGLGQTIYLEPGDYTFSAFVECTSMVHGYFSNHNNYTAGDATFVKHQFDLGAFPSMQRVSCSFKVLNGGLVFPRFETSVDGAELKIAGLMLNKGSMALPWNYSRADFDDRFANIESQIIGGGVLNYIPKIMCLLGGM